MAEPVTIVLAGLSAEISALVAGKVDLGALNTEGKILILSGASVLLVEIVLDNPAFAAGTGSDQLGAGMPKQGTAVANGTAAKAQILDCDENVVVEGTVNLIGSGSFVEIDKVEIEIGDIVTVQSAKLTGP